MKKTIDIQKILLEIKKEEEAIIGIIEQSFGNDIIYHEGVRSGILRIKELIETQSNPKNPVIKEKRFFSIEDLSKFINNGSSSLINIVPTNKDYIAFYWDYQE